MNTIDASALRLAAVIESSDDAIVSQRLDGTIDSWNPAAERMYGYTSEEVIGRPIDLIIPDDQRRADRELIAGFRAGASARHFETVALTRTGKTIPKIGRAHV